MFSGLTEIGWRWVFFFPVPLALAVLLAGIRLVPDDGRPERSGQRFDLLGAITVTAGMLLLVLTVVEAPDAGWVSARTLGSLAGALAILALFRTHEQRSPAPLVRLGILRSSALVRARNRRCSGSVRWCCAVAHPHPPAPKRPDAPRPRRREPPQASSRLRILPVALRGSESRNSTSRGTL